MSLPEWLLAPWPWWVSGPLIGLLVPLLLLLGNRPFGISSSLRHVCAAVFPAKIPFFNYNWKKESWNLVFVTGVIAGAFITSFWLSDSRPMDLNPKLVQDLAKHNISIQGFSKMAPPELFSWTNLLSLQGFILIVVGGFLIGFGTRYAGGCTSGHSITGLSNLQWPSLVATTCFMAGGFIVTNLFIPSILNW